jgi:hypothetical protein
MMLNISVKKFLAVLMDKLKLTQVNILQRNIHGELTEMCLTILYVDGCNHVSQVSRLFQIRDLGHNFIAPVQLDILYVCGLHRNSPPHLHKLVFIP